MIFVAHGFSDGLLLEMGYENVHNLSGGIGLSGLIRFDS